MSITHFLSFVPLLLIGSTTLAVSPHQFHCEGIVFEHGLRRAIDVTSNFESLAEPSPLAEVSLSFNKTDNSRLNVQIRALVATDQLAVAATFIEIAKEPLGRVDSSFFEKIFPDPDQKFRLQKSFEGLELNLVCSDLNQQ